MPDQIDRAEQNRRPKRQWCKVRPAPGTGKQEQCHGGKDEQGGCAVGVDPDERDCQERNSHKDGGRRPIDTDEQIAERKGFKVFVVFILDTVVGEEEEAEPDQR